MKEVAVFRPGRGYFGGSPQCSICRGFFVDQDQYAHKQWHAQVYTRDEIMTELAHINPTGTGAQNIMSNVEWCDKGNHAYKAVSDGSDAVVTITNNGITETQRACREHPFFDQKAISNVVSEPGYGSATAE